MEIFIDFLVNNYIWFLLITIILFFSLIGYIVDSKEQKTITVFNSPLEMQRNLTNLAASAQNKTLGEAIAPNVNLMNYPNQVSQPTMNVGNMNSYPQQNYSNVSMNSFGGQNVNYPTNLGINNNPNYVPNQTMNINSNGMNSNTTFEVLGK